MCFNMGMTDRVVRIVLGVALIAYGIIAPSLIVALIGLIPLATAAFGFCPLYVPFKINTGCKRGSGSGTES